jgi:hypothetical protein
MEMILNFTLSCKYSTILSKCLLLYVVTGFESPNSGWHLDRIINVLTFKPNVDFTLVELNKILSTTALTMILLSWLPSFSGKNHQILQIALPCTIIHQIFSVNKYFGFNLKRIMDSRGDLKLALIAGFCANVALVLRYLNKIQDHHLMLATLIGGTLHYYFMKTGWNGGALNVKAFGYIPFIIAPIALYYQFKANNLKI